MVKCIDDNWLSAISDRYKIVFSPKEGDEPWLFDLENDPDELINFYNDPDYKDVRIWMSGQLIEYGKKTKDSPDISSKNCKRVSGIKRSLLPYLPNFPGPLGQ